MAHRKLLRYLLVGVGALALVAVAADTASEPAIIGIAASGNVLLLAEYLAKHPNQIEATDKYGFTPLMTAASNGHPELVAFLLDKGARLDSIGNMGDTAINSVQGHIQTCSDDWVKQQEDWIRQQKLPADVTVARIAKIRAYYTPERKKRWEAVLALLKEAQAKQRSATDKSPLFAAIADKDVGALKQAIVANKNLLDRKRTDGRTPLIEAILSGQGEMVDLLVAAGANPKIRDADGKSAADYGQHVYAVLDKRTFAGLDELLKSGKLQIDMKDHNGESALMRAVAIGDIRGAQWLLDQGASPNVMNKKGETLEQIACTRGKVVGDKQHTLELIRTAKAKATTPKGE